jgi:TolA-binding protein
MKKILLAGISLGFLLASCQSPEEKAAEKAKQDSITAIDTKLKHKRAVDSAENVMRADKTYNMKNAMGTLKTYNDYIRAYPADTLTAEYLFRAADLAMGAKQYTESANYLETILDQHKGYRKYADACFVAAFVYDTYLENVNHGGDRAKQLYQFIIDNYPNTSYAEQSKVLITYIGTSDEEMINDIIKKGGKEIPGEPKTTDPSKTNETTTEKPMTKPKK